MKLDARLEEWSCQASGDFRYEIVHSFSGLTLSGTHAPQTVPKLHVYSSVSMAYLWNLHRIARMLLEDSLILCTFRSDEMNTTRDVWNQHSEIRARLSGKISDLIDDICSSVPYLLGEINQEGNLQKSPQNRAVGGLFLLYPLRLTLVLNRASPAQELWIAKQLEYIKNIFGIQAAINNLPTRPWPRAQQ